MLVQPDKNELGDKRLSPEEGVIKLRQECLDQAAANRIPFQTELEDQERSAGPRLYYTEILRRIRDENPNIIVKDGSPGSVALYAPKNRGEIAETEYDPSSQDWYRDHKYVGGLEKDWLPEYSHVILDTSLLPVREIRGWRTVLISLIKSGALNYQQAINQFGEAVGQRSTPWHEQLRKFKYGAINE